MWPIRDTASGRFERNLFILRRPGRLNLESVCAHIFKRMFGNLFELQTKSMKESVAFHLLPT